MTSNNSKTVTNEATGPNPSSEESERRGRNKPHQKITLYQSSKRKHSRKRNYGGEDSYNMSR